MDIQSSFDLNVNFIQKPKNQIKNKQIDLKQRRAKNKLKQIFSLKSNKLQYCNYDLPKKILKENRTILDGHVIQNISKRKCLETAIFCLASQALVFERASDFTNEIKEISDEKIENSNFIYNLAKKYLRFPEDRFTPFFEYANKYSGGLISLTNDLLKEPFEVRNEIRNKVKFMGLKTTSFWYLCLGGKELMTLDVHNLRQISNLNIVQIKESHYLGKRRSTGKCIVTGTSNKEYFEIEKKVQEYFKKNMFENLFLFENEKLNSALLTTIFWWEGVKIERGINPYQKTFFNNNLNLGKILPYHTN